ncbi:hypothetical protein [Streptomyces sp. NPDC058861]|uniref:hypothetical protein n=1 Tax=Streptomyces sp. NPDC058861 TaxID=3346653 RepID=UPI0036850EF8
MHPFHLFALQLAHHLPGTWKAIHHWYTRPTHRSVDLWRVWPPPEARPALADRLHAETLLGPDGRELYLVEHRQDRVLICPVIPYGIHEDITGRIPAPPTVAAPRDPARAAWRVTDRVLPHYTTALTDAREAAEALYAPRASTPLFSSAAGTLRAPAGAEGRQR